MGSSSSSQSSFKNYFESLESTDKKLDIYSIEKGKLIILNYKLALGPNPKFFDTPMGPNGNVDVIPLKQTKKPRDFMERNNNSKYYTGTWSDGLKFLIAVVLKDNIPTTLINNGVKYKIDLFGESLLGVGNIKEYHYISSGYIFNGTQITSTFV